LNLPLAHIWHPARVSSNRLVIVLHGRGDSAEGFAWLQEELEIESLDFLLLTAPERYYTGFSWYDLPPRELPGIRRSAGLLKEVFAKTEEAGYAPEQTFLLGFSQGCLMTLEFGARHVRQLAGYIGISGYCYDPSMLLREMKPHVNAGNWLVTHGTEDEVLPVEITRAQMLLLNSGGLKIDYREYAKGHTIDLERELPDIRTWMRSRVTGELLA
jgi:phospholipase/carboxylesterase